MKFSEIAGQKELINRTINNVKNSKVAHAQMLIGPEGSGALAFSLAYAQFINCTDKKFFSDNSDLIGDSCGTCYSCIKSQKLIHPDIHFVFPVTTTKKFPKKVLSKDFLPDFRNLIIENKGYISLNQWYETIEVENKQGIISAEECNEIITTLSYKTYESEYKIMIIWMIEKLFHSAAPKILKILEEPPDKTLFLLISDNYHNVLDTIISRVQLLKLKKLSTDDIAKSLNISLKEEKEKLTALAVNQNFNIDEIRNLYLNPENKNNFMDFFIEWMRTCFRMQTDIILTQANTFRDYGREKQKQFLKFASFQIRNAYVKQFSDELLQYNELSQENFYNNFSKYLNKNNITLIFEELNNSINFIERNATPKILFTHLSFKIGQYLKIK